MSEFPCDGGCNVNDGPSEECSAHGRQPAQIWEIVTEVSKQRDAALARVARVEALHQPYLKVFDGRLMYCKQCNFKNDLRNVVWPCATVRALTKGEPSE